RDELERGTPEYLRHWRDTDVMPDRLRLRLLWTCFAVDACDEEYLRHHVKPKVALSADPSAMPRPTTEHERAWAIRLLMESEVSPPTISAFGIAARSDKSPLVRLALASALQRLPLQDRWVIAGHLARHEEDASDHNLPLMIWYGIEPAVPAKPQMAVGLAKQAKIPLVREYIARRLTSDLERHRDAVAELLAMALERDDAFAADVLRGMSSALQGVPQTTPPDNWSR